jgi:hypothetical protein
MRRVKTATVNLLFLYGIVTLIQMGKYDLFLCIKSIDYFNYRCLNIVSIIKMKHQWLDFLHRLYDDKNNHSISIDVSSLTDRSNFVCTALLLILFSFFRSSVIFLFGVVFLFCFSPNNVLVCKHIYIFNE